MTSNSEQVINRAFETFQRFDADTKLALLWYGYLDIKDGLHPAPPYTVEQVATAFYDKIQALPQEQQLQAQREIAEGQATEIGRSYTALSPGARLDAWLLLAQGMEKGEIIGFPQNYQLPAETEGFTNQVKQFDFEQRVGFMRKAANEMGAQVSRSAQ
jgi:hypothetical protein